MDELIEALQIFRNYTDAEYPISCDIDILRVDVSPEIVTAADTDRLLELGFEPDEDADMFYSYKFGSC